MQYAEVRRGLVTQLSPTGTVACNLACGDVVQTGWSFNGDFFSPPVILTPPPSIPPAQEEAFAALIAGISIISTSTPAINSTYSLSAQSQAYINGLLSSILTNGTFFGGSLTQVFYDAANNAHVFPDVTVFKNFALAVGNFVDQVTLYGFSNGTRGSIPSSQVTIP